MLGSVSGKGDPNAAAARALRNLIEAGWITDDDIDFVMSKIPRVFSYETVKIDALQDSNYLANHVSPETFALTKVSIVSETEASSGDIDRITEKTIKAICLGHPTIVAGNPRALEFVRSWGFQTFGNVIDERYDEATSYADRLALLIEAAVSIREIVDSPGSRAHLRLSEICRHNRDHAISDAVTKYEGTVEAELMKKLVAFCEASTSFV
ncbi:hypothetical protein SS37A_37160 (plasmid) [Methylocystis iwaonis]|uniref:Uncharacterized protein n=2 Tax=Methylocystis iwaonis TaxID=2885079 RepID=A0ABM8EDS9_9HYPH|nr:hypothetical protein SS37A_37160 [Methylocystis iwaonis]